MQCPDCKRKMQPCATQFYCDWCKSPLEEVRLYPGYIVHKYDGMHSPYYVFRHVQDAERWKKEKGLVDLRITKVLSPSRFKWRKTKGSIAGLTVARMLYRVADNHRFDPNEPFVCIAPTNYQPQFIKKTIKKEEKSEEEKLKDFFFS